MNNNFYDVDIKKKYIYFNEVYKECMDYIINFKMIYDLTRTNFKKFDYLF